MTRLELYQIACRPLRPLKLGQFGESGIVACALESDSGRVFTGICIDLPCGLGFCAERAAAAEMLKNGECVIRRIVTINRDSRILPPCGSCREFLMQMNERNATALVAVDVERDLPLAQLLPEQWNKTERH